MLSRIYIVYATVLCLLFCWAGATGWSIWIPLVGSTVVRPTGPGGHYHK